MSKRLLNEEAIRRFQKLANIASGKLNEGMYKDDEPAYMGGAYKEDEPEMDAPEMDAPEMDEPMPEEKTFTEDDLVTGIKAMMDSLGVDAEVEAGDVDEAPEMDDMEADEEDLEMDMGDDKEASDEELMESMARRITSRVVRRLDESKRKDRKAEVIAERVMRRLQKLK